MEYSNSGEESRMQRMTKQRATIIKALAAKKHFLSAQQLHEELSRKGESIGLATVYRTLQSLTEADRVDTIRSPEGETLYRACGENKHHHHLICRECGRTQEFVLDNFETALNTMARRAGFSDLSHEIEVYGTCYRCSHEVSD